LFPTGHNHEQFPYLGGGARLTTTPENQNAAEYEPKGRNKDQSP
jgi:hypothetical protein